MVASNLSGVAAPEYVPTDPMSRVRAYTSPPPRPGGWTASRPGELDGGQPEGLGLGTSGPDQGYAYKLASSFEDRVHLGGVSWEDAKAGCTAVAMKRSALFGRAPVIHDLTAAFTIFGFLDADPAEELVEARRKHFAEVRSHHHYAERRGLVDFVETAMLRKPHTEIAAQYKADWRRLFAS